MRRRDAMRWMAAWPLGLIGCSRTESASSSGRPRVVATTGMIADLARGVAGELAEVSSLMGPGVDPHLYKVTIRDIGRLGGADLVLYNGLHLEGKMGDVFERLRRRAAVAAVAEAFPPERLLDLEEGIHDPHAWFDVALWGEGVPVVCAALAAVDPAHADDYARNAATTRERLRQLDEWSRSELAKVPRESRVLVTAHDAFGYFGRAYDVDVRAIQGISTESEASVRQLNELVEFLVGRRIKAVFVESTISDQNVRALIEGCAAVGHAVAVGGELYSDAPGAAGTPEGTYEGMVRHNVETIVRALS